MSIGSHVNSVRQNNVFMLSTLSAIWLFSRRVRSASQRMTAPSPKWLMLRGQQMATFEDAIRCGMD